jgi:hypothetical protein
VAQAQLAEADEAMTALSTQLEEKEAALKEARRAHTHAKTPRAPRRACCAHDPTPATLHALWPLR